MIFALILSGAVIIVLAILLFRQIREKKKMMIERNLNQRQKAALKQSLEMLMEHSSDFYFRYNRQGYVNYASSNVERLLGYAKSDGDVHFKDLITDNPINQTVFRHIDDLFKLNFDIIKPYFLEIYDNYGDRHMLEIFETPHIDDHGNVSYVNAIARDLTGMYKAEMGLKESERQQSLILDAIPDPMFMIDRELRYMDYKIGNEEDLWYRPSEFLGKRIRDVIPSPLNYAFEEACQKAFDSGKLQTLEYDFGEGESQRFFEGRVIKLNESRLLVISRDISSSKRLEKELRKAKEAAESAAQAKSNFLATMSHEIRTPMNGVVGMISLLSETEMSEEQKEYVETIQASSDTLLRIINDILDYSRIESGKLAFEENLFYLKKVIDDSIGLVRFEARKKGIIINSMVDESVPNFIRTDRGRLRQILLNLLSNAVKFTEHGSIILSVQALETTERHVELLFKVKDTGIGIPQNKLNNLFKEFTQVDSSHSRKFGGTGLGLAIVKRLVKMLHGKVTVESEVGVGTTFSFSIRAKLAGKVSAKEQMENPDVKMVESTEEYIAEDYPLQILLAEDNAINRKLSMLFMERMGYIPDVATDGLEVIKKVKEKKYDLILLDIAMPKMDGYQVVEIINNLDEEQRPLIIGVSANAFKGDIERALAAGMTAYLVKPIKFNDLRETLIEGYKVIQEAKA